MQLPIPTHRIAASSRTARTVLLMKLCLEFIIAVSVFLPELLPTQLATRLKMSLAEDLE